MPTATPIKERVSKHATEGKNINMRLTSSAYTMLCELAEDENRSLNNMVLELIKRAYKGKYRS